MTDLIKLFLAADKETHVVLILLVVLLISLAANVWQAKNWLKERRELHAVQQDQFNKVTDGLSAVNAGMSALLELVRGLSYRTPARPHNENQVS